MKISLFTCEQLWKLHCLKTLSFPVGSIRHETEQIFKKSYILMLNCISPGFKRTSHFSSTRLVTEMVNILNWKNSITDILQVLSIILSTLQSIMTVQ